MHRHTLVNHFLEWSAEKFPGKTALVHEGKRFSYAEIDSMANRLAFALKEHGVERGDRIAIYMDNCVEAVVSLFAALKAGAAFMMINHTTKAEKLRFIINNSGAVVLITQEERIGTVANIRCQQLKTVITTGSKDNGISSLSFSDIFNSITSDNITSGCIDLDLASIIYTSGSTGNPKGVMLSHLNIISAAHSITTYLENTENDIIINVLPLSFDYGLYQILMGFKIGGTVVLEKSFAYPYEVVKTMIRERVTGFPGVPTMFALLLRIKNIEKLGLRSLRYITSTAAVLPPNHIRELKELFPQAKLYSMYGVTECKRISYLPPEQLDIRPESVGKGMPNEDVYIVDEEGNRVEPGVVGELVVRGTNVMLGYWGLPEETAKCLRQDKYHNDKVLFTGDLFRMDKDGYLYFIARKDDIIKCKGEKVSPKEVENVLYNIDGILEAAVIGVPDEIQGQSIKAYVALESESHLTEKDILRYCLQHLESHMVPTYVEILESLPKSTTGKICKQELKGYPISSQAIITAPQ